MVDGINREVRVLEDPAALAEEGARRVRDSSRGAIAKRGRFTLVLAGGSTPRRTYERLAAAATEMDWARTEVFLSDERAVPQDDPDSNLRMVRESLLDRLPVQPAFVCCIEGELSPAAAALRYEEALAARIQGVPPAFDLVLLGMGGDGHTASLFPGGEELLENQRLAVPSRAPAKPHQRVTLTLPVLCAARQVLFLVAGADKAAALAAVLKQSEGPVEDALPAARVRPENGALTWLVDAAAGGGRGADIG